MSHIKKMMNHKDCEWTCFSKKVLLAKQGGVDPMLSRNMRIAQILKSTSLKGRIIIENNNNNRVNYLGGREGQIGGLPQIPRNKF